MWEKMSMTLISWSTMGTKDTSSQTGWSKRVNLRWKFNLVKFKNEVTLHLLIWPSRVKLYSRQSTLNLPPEGGNTLDFSISLLTHWPQSVEAHMIFIPQLYLRSKPLSLSMGVLSVSWKPWSAHIISVSQLWSAHIRPTWIWYGNQILRWLAVAY